MTCPICQEENYEEGLYREDVCRECEENYFMLCDSCGSTFHVDDMATDPEDPRGAWIRNERSGEPGPGSVGRCKDCHKAKPITPEDSYYSYAVIDYEDGRPGPVDYHYTFEDALANAKGLFEEFKRYGADNLEVYVWKATYNKDLGYHEVLDHLDPLEIIR